MGVWGQRYLPWTTELTSGFKSPTSSDLRPCDHNHMHLCWVRSECLGKTQYPDSDEYTGLLRPRPLAPGLLPKRPVSECCFPAVSLFFLDCAGIVSLVFDLRVKWRGACLQDELTSLRAFSVYFPCFLQHAPSSFWPADLPFSLCMSWTHDILFFSVYIPLRDQSFLPRFWKISATLWLHNTSVLKSLQSRAMKVCECI